MAADSTVRVCHVFVSFEGGGSQLRLVRMLASLDPAWQHEVVALDGRTGASRALPATVRCEVLPWQVRRGTPATVRALRRLFAARRPALVATYNFGAIDGVLAARLCGVPVVHHEEVVYADEQGFVAWRRHLLRRLVLRGAAAVVVPSRRLAARAQARWGLPNGKLRRIPNGVVVPASAVAPKPGAAAPLVVGCVAGFRPEKNQARLLRAFAALRDRRDVELWFAGDGPLRRTCELLAQELRLEAVVRFLGHVDDPTAVFRALDVFVLPSDDEQMPLALLEAMAHGLPVVATAVGDVVSMLPSCQQPFVVALGADEHVGADRRAVRVVRHDHGGVEAMAAAMARLLASSALRAELGAENRARVHHEFSLAAMAGCYDQLYRTAIVEGVA